MRVLLAILLVAGLLAGCNDAVPATNSDDKNPDSDFGLIDDNATQDRKFATQVMDFSFDGRLSTFAHGCVFLAGQCPTTPPVGSPEKSDLYLDHAGGNLTSLRFNVSWQGTAATQKLAVGAMVMADCDGCTSTLFGEVTGVSPITVTLQDLNVPVNASARIHVYVYNPTFFQVVAPAGYALISVEQTFKIDGLAGVLVVA